MATRPTERFLGPEGKRNRHNAALYQALLCVAWGECEVITGHHINFEFEGKIETEDEIPSADTLLFHHGIMHAVFAEDAPQILSAIALLPPYEREQYVCAEFNLRYPDEAVTLEPR